MAKPKRTHLKMDPDKIKKLPAVQSCYYACGYKSQDLKKPNIAVIFSQNNICPGHTHLNELARSAAKGISKSGGTPVLMNAGVGVCDGIAMGHVGMKYSLASRENNADACELMVRSHAIFSGIVFIGACDKNLPGYFMAAARLNLPSIFITAGPMMPGKYKNKKLDILDSFAADAQYALNKISKKEYENIIEKCMPGCGSCSGLFTANSMACVTEAIGLSLPGMAAAHADTSKKHELSEKSGRIIMKLVKKDIKALDIITKKSVENAIVLDMAIGASTNTILHMQAISGEAGIEITPEKINTISRKTPNIVKLSPSSDQHMIDLDNAGGIPAVLKELKDLLHDTVTAESTLYERISRAENKDKNIIRDIKNPYSGQGGLVILSGNISPEGSVIKTSGIHPDVGKIFRGTARVFDSEEDATAYIKSGRVQPKEVIVIRYEGPAGGPGMREMLYPTSAIKGLKMDKEVALITDGRFSGATSGICVGHIAPEAYNKGLIAFVENNDEIEIDLEKKELNLLVDEEVIKNRKNNWKRIKKPIKNGILKTFRKKFTFK
ncbi:dihydroxy-acid dehydratase [Candidatus Woesearchaeota archaeon]|nr:dihydroxy-acid dehydratase [Candidatus Woesearchaeota archaeon]